MEVFGSRKNSGISLPSGFHFVEVEIPSSFLEDLKALKKKERQLFLLRAPISFKDENLSHLHAATQNGVLCAAPTTSDYQIGKIDQGDHLMEGELKNLACLLPRPSSKKPKSFRLKSFDGHIVITKKIDIPAASGSPSKDLTKILASQNNPSRFQPPLKCRWLPCGVKSGRGENDQQKHLKGKEITEQRVAEKHSLAVDVKLSSKKKKKKTL
eukprot:Sdes_comp20287_c0_seq1m13869